jgi:hypothetical protein
MHDEPDFIDFPDLPDEAVIAINDFIEEFYVRFQNHYFAQMHRYRQDRPPAHGRYDEQIPLPLDDPNPPF